MLDATSERRREFGDPGRRLLLLLHERLVDDAVFQNLAELREAMLARAESPARATGLRPRLPSST